MRTAYFKLASFFKSVVSCGNPITPEELITLYNKYINGCLLPNQLKLAQLRLAEANSQITCVEDFVAWFKVTLNQLHLLEISKLLQMQPEPPVNTHSLFSKEWRRICALPWHTHDSTLGCFWTFTTTLLRNWTLKKL